MAHSVFDPDGTRLPIKVDTATNGEYYPKTLTKTQQAGNALAHERATESAKRLGLDRRSFLTSTAGAASTLIAINDVHAAAGARGGAFGVTPEAALDMDLAQAELGKSEFIFDLQGHCIGPIEQWRPDQPRWKNHRGYQFMPQGSCAYPLEGSDVGYLACFSGEAFTKEMFMDSDTDMAVLTFPPTTEEEMMLTHAEADDVRRAVEALEGTHRLLMHGRVIPNLPGDLDRMAAIQEQWPISAWKTYTQYSPDVTTGWWLDDEEWGRPFLEAVRASGVKRFCVHKGMPLPFLMGTENEEFASCRDVGPAATAYPDLAFIIYHAGMDTKIYEGPFEPGNPKSGTDTLCQSLLDADIAPGGNVYAELGSTWREVMKDPDEAAHLMGKLLKYVGEDNIVWGTDCIWYGSPQDQIQAFRSFQITEEYQERYGYPALTDAVKAKIFGLNGARIYGLEPDQVRKKTQNDVLERVREAYGEAPDPTYMTYGPRTRREVVNLWRHKGDIPG